MIIEHVDENNLAALIVCDYMLEKSPLPFRGQKDVTFVIAYSEYIYFRRNNPDLSKLLLSNLILGNLNFEVGTHDSQGKLYKAYLLDVAVAVGKEMWYAEKCNVVSTRILHEMPAVIEYTSEEVKVIGNKISNDTLNVIWDFMSLHGYEKIKNFSNKNESFLLYMRVLVDSAIKQIPWSLQYIK